jgi:hypothetical protein
MGLVPPEVDGVLSAVDGMSSLQSAKTELLREERLTSSAPATDTAFSTTADSDPSNNLIRFTPMSFVFSSENFPVNNPKLSEPRLMDYETGTTLTEFKVFPKLPKECQLM